MDQPTDTDKPVAKPVHSAWRRGLSLSLALIGLLVGINAGYIGYLYASSPHSIRQPLYEHYHFRMQLLVDGKGVNLAEAKYQEGYSKDNCNATLSEHPIHLHDKRNQFVHIHWEGMTGGQVLKYYGWNVIGGTKGSLGYRFDKLPKLQKIPIHGNVLPAVPSNATFYVYSGDANGYKQRTIEEFSQQDLEKFFGTISNSPAHQLNKQKRSGLATMLTNLSPKVAAQAQTADGATAGQGQTSGDNSAPSLTGEELTRLNNLIGNVVVFAQKQPPSDAQIKAQFNNLEPLNDSTCGG